MEKTYIEILNVGPIKDVKIELNKINVFIGEQSSGKSTIAKIISFCHWVEKDISIRQSLGNYKNDNTFFIQKLISFHKMKDYFNRKSEILYKSNVLKLHYKNKVFKIDWQEQFNYKRMKISYIPSERSVAVLPEMEKVELPNNYIKSFLFDWFDARKNYSEKENLSLLNLDINYYFSEDNRENHIIDKKKSYNIILSNASSGLQSVTPLIVLAEHLTKNLYLQEQNSSYELDQVLHNVTYKLFNELVVDKYDSKSSAEEILKTLAKKGDNDKKLSKLFNNFIVVRNSLFKTNSTNLIIEEPEQNLFPSTQKALIYYLLERINSKKEHLLTLTTHSPYVLYALNNCIMASIVEKRLLETEKEKLQCLSSKINPKFISIYQIKDGTVIRIQKDDGLISNNYFDEQMKNIMDEFYVMLNHYES